MSAKRPTHIACIVSFHHTHNLSPPQYISSAGLDAACWFYAQGISRLQIPENYTTTHRQLVGLIQYYTGPGVYDLIHTIEKPVMLFTGGLDKIVPPIDQRVAAKQIREPWLITYPDAAHAAFIQHLPTTISAIDLFLAQEDFDA